MIPPLRLAVMNATSNAFFEYFPTVIFILSIVFFLRWLYRAYLNLRILNDKKRLKSLTKWCVIIVCLHLLNEFLLFFFHVKYLGIFATLLIGICSIIVYGLCFVVTIMVIDYYTDDMRDFWFDS
jgi:hypothetical protein